MQDYNNEYHSLLRDILNDGENINNNRTNYMCKTLYHRTLSVDLSRDKKVPTINTRKLYPKSAAAELAWTLLGTQTTNFIKKYSKMWHKFEDEPDIIIPAYGYRWRKHFGRDQLIEAIEALKADKSNRQIWVTAWDASEDGLTNIGKYKNVPCPLGFMLNITENEKLNMSVVMRSSDVIVGLPYDVMMYSMLCFLIAKSLRIMPGKLTFFLNNVHIYEPYIDAAKSMIFGNYLRAEGLYRDQQFVFGNWDVESVVESPHYFVSKIEELSRKDKYPPVIKLEVIE